MTISTLASTVTLLGNGATTVFPFTFVGVSASDISVIYTDTSGVQTTLSPTQYTLSLNAPTTGSLWGTGGTVTYPKVGSPITAGTSITILRTLPLSQDTDISNQGNFAPQVIESALDVLCMEIQQVSSRTGQIRGSWVSGAFYNYGDIVVDSTSGTNTGNLYSCALANTAGTWSTDLANGVWSLALNVQNLATHVTGFLPLTGGTISGALAVTGGITGDLTGGTISGALVVTGGITGALTGNASTATDTPETSVNLGSITGATSLNLSSKAGVYFHGTITGTTTFTVTSPPASTVGSFTLLLADGGSQTITWTNGKWPGGAAPALSTSGTDVIVGFTPDAGTTVYLFLSGKGLA